MDELEIKRLLKTVYNKKLYIAMIILLFILAGYIYSYYYVTPKYKSETTIILIKNTEESTAKEITQSDINLNQKLVSTYGEIIKSNKVIRTVIKNLDLDISENKLNNLISVTDINNTEILKITVVNQDAKLAKNIANEVAKVFSEEVMKLYKIDNVNVIDEAEEAVIPYNINHVKDIAIFGVIGIVVSALFVFVMYYFDSTIKEEEDVESYIGVNLLTTIPMQQKYMKNKNGKRDELEELITYEDYKSPISEFFRTLRTNIMFTQTNNNIKTILVTSGMMGEGKSWVTANLATAFAQSNKTVLLIDSDMRKGRQHHIFNVKNNVGLSNCLAMKKEEITSKDNFKKYIQETKIENLHIMTSGNRPPNPSELLSSEKMKLIIDTLKSIYDIVIFDGTPCMLVSDSVILSNMVDTSIIVAEYRKSKIENTKKLKKSIENAGGIIGGLVLNKLPISAKSYKSKYYYGEKNTEKLISLPNSEVKSKSVEELIEQSNLDIIENNVPKINNVENMSVDDRILELENMIERYFNANNELMKKNMTAVEEIKSNFKDLAEKQENKAKKTTTKKATTVAPKKDAKKVEKNDTGKLKKEEKNVKKVTKKSKEEKEVKDKVSKKASTSKVDKKVTKNETENKKKTASKVDKKTITKKETPKVAKAKKQNVEENNKQTGKENKKANVLKLIVANSKADKKKEEEEIKLISQILRV